MRNVGRGIVVAVAVVSAAAWADSTGKAGYSGKVSAKTCITGGCHEGQPVAPTVKVTGPTSVAAGSDTQYQATIEATYGNSWGITAELEGGAKFGTLGTSAPLKKIDGVEEIVHQSPATGAGKVTYTFNVIAPSSAGAVTLWVQGAACNGEGTKAGDSSAIVKTTITVTGAAGGGDGGISGDGGTGLTNVVYGGCDATGAAPMLAGLMVAVGLAFRRRR